MVQPLDQPDFWLAVGLPWPASETGEIAECVTVLAPPTIHPQLVSPAAHVAFQLATAEFGSPELNGSRMVFFSDLSRRMIRQGTHWPGYGVDVDAVLGELSWTRVPRLHFTLNRPSHAMVCDPTLEGPKFHPPVTQPVAELRHEVRLLLERATSDEWSQYVHAEHPEYF